MLDQIFGVEIAFLLGLITVDVLLGMAAAVRTHSFSWSTVNQFYMTMILPMLIGWGAFALLFKLTLPNVLLGSDVAGTLLREGVPGLAYLLIVRDLAYSIIENTKAVFKGLNL